MDIKIYEAQADTIDVDDIATKNNNRLVLRRVKRNEADADENDNELYIQSQPNYSDEDEEDYVHYVPEGSHDMGWLGYFVGKNDHLQKLVILPFPYESVRDVIMPFFRGVCNNKSLQTMTLKCISMDILGGEMFTMLGTFFQNNHNLTSINIAHCDFGDDGARLFALAIGSSTHKSLKSVDLEYNNIEVEGMVDIITALSTHPHLEKLYLIGNLLHKNGCVALATLLRCSTNKLQHLDLSNSEINDDEIEALVPALANCSRLESLHISYNSSITTQGWQSFATILESPTSNLQELYITDNNIDDESASAFANALANNHTLHILDLDDNIDYSSITNIGWKAFSKTLCNTSSVNATFLSNHTLNEMSNEAYGNEILDPLLDLNGRDDKKEVAVIKILKNHDDFDMLPFFEWEFKVLPMVLGWLERASDYEMPEHFEPNIERRKLSTIYQFVRGMPLLYVETCLRKELEDIKAEQSQMEAEESKREEEFIRRKQMLQERSRSIMRRLGKQ